MKKFAWSFCLLAVALCIALPAMADDTLYSNLGTGSDVYNCCSGWTVSGTGTLGTSFTAANEFTAMASGNISQIDIAATLRLPAPAALEIALRAARVSG